MDKHRRVEHASIMAIIITLSTISLRSRGREKKEGEKEEEEGRNEVKGKKRMGGGERKGWEAFVRFPCRFVQSVACS